MFTKKRAQWSFWAQKSMAKLKRLFGIVKQEKEETLSNGTVDFLPPKCPETESFSIDSDSESEWKPLQTDSKLSPSNNSHCHTSMISFDQTWTIDNFSCLSDGLNQPRYCTESLPFGPANNVRVKFRLALYPYGYDIFPDFVSLYVLIESIDQPVQVICNFSIIDANGAKLHRQSSNVTTLAHEDEGFYVGFQQYMPRREILCPNSGLLVNDSLTIYCQIHQWVVKSVIPDSLKDDYSFPENELLAKCAHLWGDKTYAT